MPGIFDERLDAGDVEDLALEEAALDLELGLVLGPLERDLAPAAAATRVDQMTAVVPTMSWATSAPSCEPLTAILTSEFLRTR